MTLAELAALKRRRGKHLGVPTEAQEMLALAVYLDVACGPLGWIHVPNEGKRSAAGGALMRRMGLKKGAPDVLIFREARRPLGWDRPADRDTLLSSEEPHGVALPRGIAIELKREGATNSSLSCDQENFGCALADNGWYWFVARGAREAIDELRRLGFGK